MNNHRQPAKKCSSQRLGERSITEGHYIALQSGCRLVRRKAGRIGKLNRRQVPTFPGTKTWLQTHPVSWGIRAEPPSNRIVALLIVIISYNPLHSEDSKTKSIKALVLESETPRLVSRFYSH